MATISNTDTHDNTVEQGKTYIETFTCQVLTNPALPWDSITNPYIPLDLTTYNVRMQVRKTYDTATTEIYAVNLTTTGAVIRFTKVNNTGVITLTLIPEDTANLRFTGDSATYVYDIELAHTTQDIVLLVSKGSFIINRESTR